MKNKEKYAKEIVEMAIDGELLAINKNNRQIVSCVGSACANCLFCGGSACPQKRREWAESEAPEIPLNTPIDTPIWVRHKYDTTWVPRHFAGFSENGEIMAFDGRKTSWTTTCVTTWPHARLAKQKEIEKARKKWKK